MRIVLVWQHLQENWKDKNDRYTMPRQVYIIDCMHGVQYAIIMYMIQLLLLDICTPIAGISISALAACSSCYIRTRYNNFELKYLRNFGGIDFKTEQHTRYIAVSYTHLTLPTIYSV